LAHAELEPSGLAPLRRELDLTESVLRYLVLQVEVVPDEERALTEAESAAGFVVPPPPEEPLHGEDDGGGGGADEEDEAGAEAPSEETAVPAGELAEEEA
jgi:hypothetical protein